VVEGQVKRTDFWNLALGYAQYLGGKPAEAKVKLAAVRDGEATTPAVRRQAETFLWLVDIVRLQAIDRDGETRLFKEYRRIRDYFPLYPPHLLYSPYSAGDPESRDGEGEEGGEIAWSDPKFRFLCSALARLYGKQGDTVKAFLATEHWSGGSEPPDVIVQLKNGPWRTKDNKAQRELVEGLIAFAGRKNRSEFEDFLLREKYRVICPASGIAGLLTEQKAMLLMRRCLWSEVVETLEPAVSMDSLQVPGPFAEHALHPWGGGDEKLESVTRQEFASAMAALTRKANTRADAKTCYRLGCALYNISYFGPCWELLTFGRSPSGDYDSDTTEFLLKEAARRFAQAEKAAKDREQAAHACFRQADIALKLHVFSLAFDKALHELPSRPSADGFNSEYYSREFLALRAFANPHFPRLKQQYAATAYYKQAVKECKLFEYYASRR